MAVSSSFGDRLQSHRRFFAPGGGLSSRSAAGCRRDGAHLGAEQQFVRMACSTRSARAAPATSGCGSTSMRRTGSAPVRSTSTRYSATSAKRCRIVCKAPGCRLLPRNDDHVIDPAADAAIQPHQRPAARTGPRIDAHQIAGAIAHQRAARPIERGQHQLALGSGRHRLRGGGIDHLRQVFRLQQM